MQSIELLKNLPDISFVDKNVEDMLAESILEYEQAYFDENGEVIKLYPGNKIRIFIYTQILKLYQAYQKLDFAAKQNFIKYATGGYLDNLAATRTNTVRLAAQKSKVTVRFTLSASQASDVTIPTGTRVTAGDNVFFAVNENKVITAGNLTGDFIFECTEAGLIGNGYVAGVINTLVDPIPYVQSVSSVDTSQGGAEIENDESLKERTWLAPEGYSVAGPLLGYLSKVLDYSQSIIDVYIDSPDEDIELSYKIGATTYNATVDQSNGNITGTDITSGAVNLSDGVMNVVFANPVSEITATIPPGGKVEIRPLLDNYEIPDQAFLDGLETAISAEDERPMTDQVLVSAPEVVNYGINLTYYISNFSSATAPQIQEAVDQAIQDYIIWQKSKIGRDINPDELTKRIVNAGAKRASIITPVYTNIEKYQLAVNNSLSVTYGGLEDG